MDASLTAAKEEAKERMLERKKKAIQGKIDMKVVQDNIRREKALEQMELDEKQMAVSKQVGDKRKAAPASAASSKKKQQKSASKTHASKSPKKRKASQLSSRKPKGTRRSSRKKN